jgi:hypothetical protein
MLLQMANYRCQQAELRDKAVKYPKQAEEFNAKIAEIEAWIRGCEQVLRQI